MTEDKTNQLSMIEQSLQSMIVQKQGFQTQVMELENALKELENSPVTYKMISNIMVKADKAELKKDLSSKLDMFKLRIKTIEKQESKMRETAQELQSELMKKMDS